MHKKIAILVAGAVALGGGTAAQYWWTVSRFIETTDNAYAQGDISIISPKVTGYVQGIHFVDNEFVKSGDILLKIEDEEFVAKVNEAVAMVEVQQSAIGTIESRLALQRSLIAQASAQVASAEAELQRNRQDYHRLQQLHRSDFASQQRLEVAEADLLKAQSSLASAQAGLAAEHDQVHVLESSRLEAEAKRRQAEANLAVVRNNLDNTVIRAPIDGVVGNRSVQLGQNVRVGMQLLSIVPLPNVHVVANFKETQVANMRPGQPVTLSVDAFPDQELQGRVESFAPASGSQFSLLPAENATGNFTKIVQRIPVRISIPPETPLSGLMRPGMSVKVAVDTRSVGIGAAFSQGVFGVALPSRTQLAQTKDESADQEVR